MNIRPLGDRVVVLRLPAEDKIGSIYVPDAAKEKPTRAKVVAVGPGRVLENGQRIEPRVRIGDVVLFTKYSGTEFKSDGDEYLCITESDILGVYEG